MATRAQRDDRDERILRMWIAGMPYTRIGQAVGLTAARVESVVKAALESGASRRALLSQKAFEVHQERHERLFEAHWQMALDGDHRSAELCRRLMDQNARLHGLYAPVAAAPAGSAKPDEEPADELAELRARRGNSAG